MTNVLIGFLIVGVFVLGLSIKDALRAIRGMTKEPVLDQQLEDRFIEVEQTLRRIEYEEERVRRDMLENIATHLNHAQANSLGYTMHNVGMMHPELAHQAYDEDLYNAEPHFEFPAVKPPQTISGIIPWTEPDAPYQSKWGSHPDEVNMRTAPYTVAHCEERPEDCADRQA